MKFAQQLLLVCLAGVVLGCGQKGPLVMPDAQKHKRTIPTLPGAPAKPASGSGAAAPAPEGAGSTNGPAPPPPAPAPATPAPAPTSPSTPPPSDLTHR
ncbi:MAG TPA: lipoprotein [Steroidobacteraceae bacterium]|nr:lipoprotein [Steroidobacteraceae bacterium]